MNSSTPKKRKINTKLFLKKIKNTCKSKTAMGKMRDELISSGTLDRLKYVKQF